MTVGDASQEKGERAGLLTRLVGFALWSAAAAVAYFFAVLPMNWPQQALFGGVCFLMALLAARVSDSYLVTLTLILLSIFSTVRYGYWRVTQVIAFFQHPRWNSADAFFILCLLLAELYAGVVLFLGYFQSLWPLRRAPVAMPEDLEEWPHIDVLIPTYNEPLDVVRFTALGALNMDWPLEKLHVYLLDDGRRPKFEEFARAAGIGYRTRENNTNAKAGNLNAALATTDSPFVVIFDADHVPTRSFLQMTVGWFLRDAKLAVLQTPQHFYSPDPFERNLQQFRAIPNEGQLFYGVVQDGNDLWNASYFCGSCAVLRRAALDAIGGIAIQTVTEDAHTSLRLQKAGWGTAYINIPQAAGLATERLSDHVAQRIRWARGMIQILRLENPLFARGLSLPQRLCYFNAMAHFLYAIPRLIFLTAPLVFLLLHHNILPGGWAAILAFALPHLAFANVTNSRIQGEHRYSFWNDIYETVLSPYILQPTILAFLRPTGGKFNVIPKGSVVGRTFFDTRIAQPFLMLLLLNLAGLAVAIPRYFLWDTDRRGTVLMNVLWCLFNVVILGVCAAVAREMRQVRASVRIKMVTPVIAKISEEIYRTGETIDLSSGGTSIRFTEPVEAAPQTEVRVAFPMPTIGMDLPATVVCCEGTVLRVRFEQLSIPEQEVLTMVLYSRADSWLGWGEARRSDQVLASLARIFGISMRGLTAALGSLFRGKKQEPGPLSIVRPTALLLAAGVLLGGAARAAGQRPSLETFLRNVRVTARDAQRSSVIAGLEEMFRVPSTGFDFQPLRIGSRTIQVPSRSSLNGWFAQAPWIAALSMFSVCLLLAVWLRQRLRCRARGRLRRTCSAPLGAE